MSLQQMSLQGMSLRRMSLQQIILRWLIMKMWIFLRDNSIGTNFSVLVNVIQVNEVSQHWEYMVWEVIYMDMHNNIVILEILLIIQTVYSRMVLVVRKKKWIMMSIRWWLSKLNWISILKQQMNIYMFNHLFDNQLFKIKSLRKLQYKRYNNLLNHLLKCWIKMWKTKMKPFKILSTYFKIFPMVCGSISMKIH